jgi:transcription elongation factor GreA
MSVIDGMWLTREGWERLREELVSLRSSQGALTSDYMSVVRGSEPGEAGLRAVQSDIDSARRRISQLEEMLSRALPVDPAEREPGLAGVGSRVVVLWEEEDGEEEYILVGPPEVDLSTSRISYESPVGQAVMGRRKGEWIEVSTPNGLSRLQILDID